jgi:hypothetical protein
MSRPTTGASCGDATLKTLMKARLGRLNQACVRCKPHPGKTTKTHQKFVDESVNFLIRSVEGIA